MEKIEILLKQKKTKREIALEIGVSERTIYREIKRGKVEIMTSELVRKTEYCAETSQIRYEEKKEIIKESLKSETVWDW